MDVNNIPLNQTTSLLCDECNGKTFNEVVMIQKVSRLISGGSADGIIPIPVFACHTCGNVNAEFIPQELK